MVLYIKNMVCHRCILAVEHEVKLLNLSIESLQLGELTLQNIPSKSILNKLHSNLEALGFEILDNSKQQLIEQIKIVIIEYIQKDTDYTHKNFSQILTNKINKDYSFLSNLFSAVEGITIEKYLIHQKIEKAKELLIYNELSLSEIAFKLHYSSVAHLSNQFKKITGLTPSHFKNLGINKRLSLDKV
ncbi:MAG TPA: AraC family transcriptional regulator [Saprospiraceae bacterium]|nr:AraC family transcriptional regulator [Saprospiraceae bacterium]